jgi:hypothetical protein
MSEAIAVLLQPHRHPAPAIQKETLSASKSRARCLPLLEIEDLILDLSLTLHDSFVEKPHKQVRLRKSVKLSSIPSTSEMVWLLG